MAGRDIRRAEDKITRHIRAYQRARKALKYLEAGNKVMDKYRPICPQDLALRGDVVEDQRLGQRNDTLAWFWHIGIINQEQGIEWMDERARSSWLTSSPVSLATSSLQGQMVGM